MKQRWSSCQKGALTIKERRAYIRARGYDLQEVWECEFSAMLKVNQDNCRDVLRLDVAYRSALTFQQLVDGIRGGYLFGFLHCDISIPEDLRGSFKNFPPIFKNVDVSRDDIGDHMRQHAEENGLLRKPTRMLISSFYQQDGCFITPMVKFLLEKGAEITRIYWFVEYVPEKCFKPFVESVVEARRKGDDNKDSAVEAETMKLIANISYGIQLMDRTKHRNTVYATDSKADKLINLKTFHSLNTIEDDVYEVTSLKSSIVHKEPLILGFFILQYAKLRMLELYYNFSVKFCDSSLFEEIEMDTDSLYLALRTRVTDRLYPRRCSRRLGGSSPARLYGRVRGRW